MKLLAFSVIFFLVLSTGGSNAATGVTVIDGDTLVVGGYSIRVLNLDTPERVGFKCATEKALADGATRRARDLVAAAKTVTVVTEFKRDNYGRLLGHIWLDDLDLATKLKDEGFARSYDPKVGRQSWCAKKTG